MKTYIYIALAAIALGFAACSQENIVPQDDQKDTPITIQSAGVAELISRAIYDGVIIGQVDEPVYMGVFIRGGSADKYNYQNVEYTHNGTSWAGETMLYEGVGSAQQIYAYYPYVEDTTGTITVNAAEQIDYLVATPANLASSTVSLTMSHALAKLVLEATMGLEAKDETIAKVEVQNMFASGTWTIVDNSWSGLSASPDATLEMTKNEVLVIPMESCSHFPIIITTGTGRVFKTAVSLEKVGNKLVAGAAYTIKLQVGQDKVTIERTTIGNDIPGWDNDSEEDLN